MTDLTTEDRWRLEADVADWLYEKLFMVYGVVPVRDGRLAALSDDEYPEGICEFDLVVRHEVTGKMFLVEINVDLTEVS